MKIRWIVLLCLVGLLTCGSASALVVQVDEFGNGTINGVPIQGYMAPDPGPGGLPMALTYNLPFAGRQGDLWMFEPPGNVLIVKSRMFCKLASPSSLVYLSSSSVCGASGAP